MIRTKTFTTETLVFFDKEFCPSWLTAVDFMALIDFVSGEDNCLHQAPRAMEQIQPWIRTQHPWLADVPDLDGIDSKEEMETWFRQQIERFGSSHDVDAMPPGKYDSWDAQHALREQEAKEAEEEAERQKRARQSRLASVSSSEGFGSFSVEDIVAAGGKSVEELFRGDK